MYNVRSVFINKKVQTFNMLKTEHSPLNKGLKSNIIMRHMPVSYTHLVFQTNETSRATPIIIKHTELFITTFVFVVFFFF